MKSSVSRRWVALSQALLNEWLSDSLKGNRLAIPHLIQGEE